MKYINWIILFLVYMLGRLLSEFISSEWVFFVGYLAGITIANMIRNGFLEDTND